MNYREKITISVNEEDVQNIINAYEKDIEYINQLEKENQRLKETEKEHQRINGRLHLEIKELQDRIDKAIEYIYDNDLFHEEYNGGCNCYFSSDSQEKKDLLDLLKGDKE